MLREVLQELDLKPGLTVVDGTVGAGGHSQKISEQIGETGILIGLDRDSMMLNFAAERVSGAGRHLFGNQKRTQRTEHRHCRSYPAGPGPFVRPVGGSAARIWILRRRST